MKTKSRNYIKIQTSPIFEHNSLNNQYITYNKPLFINMSNETNKSNNYKTSTLSTKLNTSNLESTLNGSYKRNIINNNISIREFELEKNYSKTTDNFFISNINFSFNSNEKNNKSNDTFTPGKEANMIKNEEEQFTPYLGEKNNENKNCYKNSVNKDDINNKEKNNFSNIFNNSKEIITRSSLNLKNHLDDNISNNSKMINKYQKLSFYQKHINNCSKMNNIHTNNDIYNKKSILLKRYFNKQKINNINENKKNVVLIQAVFRGYIYRIKLYNKLKNCTYITIFCQTLNNIVLRRKEYIFKGWIYLIKKYNKFKKRLLLQSNRISIFIKGNENERINLVNQNNNLKIKLSEFLINNTKLKMDINILKEFEIKYYNLLRDFEKLKNINNNLIKDNNKLLAEVNVLKYKKDIKLNNICISPQHSIYFKINNKGIKSNDSQQKIQICNITNISLLNKRNESGNNSALEKQDKNVSISNNIQKSELHNNLENLELFKDKEKMNDKDYKLIIVKKINFIIKRIQKKK